MSSTRSVRRTSARMREEAGLQGRRLVAISSRGEKKRNVSKCDANQQKPASDFVCWSGSARRRLSWSEVYASEKRSNSASSVEQTPGKHTTKSFRSHYCSGAPETKYVEGSVWMRGPCVHGNTYIFFAKYFQHGGWSDIVNTAKKHVKNLRRATRALQPSSSRPPSRTLSFLHIYTWYPTLSCCAFT